MPDGEPIPSLFSARDGYLLPNFADLNPTRPGYSTGDWWIVNRFRLNSSGTLYASYVVGVQYERMCQLRDNAGPISFDLTVWETPTAENGSALFANLTAGRGSEFAPAALGDAGLKTVRGAGVLLRLGKYVAAIEDTQDDATPSSGKAEALQELATKLIGRLKTSPTPLPATPSASPESTLVATPQPRQPGFEWVLLLPALMAALYLWKRPS